METTRETDGEPVRSIGGFIEAVYVIGYKIAMVVIFIITYVKIIQDYGILGFLLGWPVAGIIAFMGCFLWPLFVGLIGIAFVGAMVQ